MKVRNYSTGEIRQVVRIWKVMEDGEFTTVLSTWVFDNGRHVRFPEMSSWVIWDEDAEVTPVTPKS